MRALVHNAETYDSLNHIEGFAKCFPHLMAQLAKGHVWSWDDHGITGELTPEQAEYIEELEDRHSDEELTVYAVLDNHTRVMGNAVHMTCYLFVTNEGYEISSYDSDTFYALADVRNETWDINEMGSVLIRRCLAGGPKRVG